MRLPKSEEDLTGKVCVCSVGRAAIVTGRSKIAFSQKANPIDCWIGIGFDGKGTWASTAPAVVAESVQEFHDRLFTRFGGKLSFNG